ncbi:hypothetical protein [Zavarzinella formosa]|uniref:hypothetical protein n=1 Tax=Zavarzinella formosa TaxID=360055 RepID=UPI0002E1C2F8|nr:hypothetical protein [Zavarzinella formosa]
MTDGALPSGDIQEIRVTYSLDTQGGPVRDAEYLRLAELMRDGWVLVGLEKTIQGDTVAYAATLWKTTGRDPGRQEGDGDAGG